MSNTIKKHKGLFLICLAILALVLLTAAYTLYKGRENKPYAKTESFSEVSGIISIAEELGKNDIENTVLPECYLRNGTYVSSVSISKEKRRTAIAFSTSDCDIEITKYNYAYLYEDDPQYLPDDTKKIRSDGFDIFIYKDDGRYIMTYYKDCIKYVFINSSEDLLTDLAKSIS